VRLTGKAEVADEFCEFYSQVGQKLAAKVKREREGAFLECMGDRVGESLFWRLTTPWRWTSCVVPWIHIKVLAGMKSPHESSKRWLMRSWAPCPICLTVV
jgi:hypothetical protein